ncbi:MAG: T9SS type A sorting domain-containing protein [Bacteroidota bacterium]
MKTVAIIIAFIGFIDLKAQIPNNGFELWTIINGYNSPSSWGNLNATTKSYSVYTCAKLSPGNPGSNYLAVISQSITGKGVVPGRVVSGKIDTVTYKPISGFPFSSRPASLSYNMQYMVTLPSDTAYVSVTLTKWNSMLMKRDTVAFGKSIFNAMAHIWYTSYTYLNYMSGENPDSACIVISASGNNPIHNSFIYIDNLQFVGNVIGVNEYEVSKSELSLYPNPTNDKFYFSTKSVSTEMEYFELRLIDTKGHLHYKADKVNRKDAINVSSLDRGIYFIELRNEKSRYRNKIVIN